MLFSEVNTELINKESLKKRKTNRYPISPLFKEATDCMKEMLDLFKEIKIISLAEVQSN
jgi:hypothetical protein